MMNFEKKVLNSGLRVVLVPMKDVQTVTVEVLVEAGSKYENQENNGISHFLEHMMFKGTKKRPTAKLIAEELDSVGGDYNAFTGKEQTGYWVKVPKKHLNLALDIVSDMYINSLLEQKEINKERGVILQEDSMYKDTPMRYVWDVFEELLYGDQPAGWQIIGTQDNIKRFKKKDFVDYLKKMYLPESTVVVISGNFDETTVLKKVEKSFEGLKSNNKKASKLKTNEKQLEPMVKIFNKETDQSHLLLGFRGPNMFSKDRYKAVLLGTVLGGGMSSRTFSNIRERYGLTYYIGAASELSTDTGFLFARAGVEHKNLLRAVELFMKEFQDLKENLISEKELLKAKEYIKGNTLMSLESTTAVANFFGDQELFYGKVRDPQELFDKIDAVTSDDLKGMARRMFINKNLNLAVIGPHQNKEDSLKEFLRVN